MPTTAEQHAEDYGYQLSFLKSDPELYKIFQTAMSKKWDATRFVAAVKASRWYKTHGEAYRQNLAQRTTDPASYRQKALGQQATIADLARQMGATLDHKTMVRIADDAIMMGWNEAQIRNTLAAHVSTRGKGQFGQTGTDVARIMQSAYRNGVNLTRDWANKFAANIAAGNASVEDAERQIRSMAVALAPGFAKELEGGMDLYDIATPYMQSMAQTLELNPSDIDLYNPTIRKALTSSSDKDGQAGSTPLWQFEQQLRQDPRFMKTKQAQDSTMAVGKQVLSDMGLIG